MTRTDTHKPSLLDPAEYDFMAAFYQGDSPWIAQAYREDMREYETAISSFPVFQGNHAAKLTCDHCGAAFAHGVLFKHLPTQELVHIGHICAGNTVGLPSKAAAARKRAEREAKELQERHERREAGQEWRVENYELMGWLATTVAKENAHPFLRDMHASIEKWGKLTDRQTAATIKWWEAAKRREANQAEQAEILADAPALAEGRMELTGDVISTKYQDSDFGTVRKMLVALPDGNRVWGTVPRSIDETDLEGESVNFTATVKRSDRDEHFGFFSRPSGARIL